jgi:uronate dehydrogenase
VICIRIGTCFPEPWDERGLATWLSPDDGGRLFEACLTAEAPGYRIIWGVSDNTRRVCSLREAEALGYRSLDNAESFAAKIMGDQPPSTPDGPVFMGGGFTTAPLGVHNPL